MMWPDPYDNPFLAILLVGMVIGGFMSGTIWLLIWISMHVNISWVA